MAGFVVFGEEIAGVGYFRGIAAAAQVLHVSAVGVEVELAFRVRLGLALPCAMEWLSVGKSSKKVYAASESVKGQPTELL